MRPNKYSRILKLLWLIPVITLAYIGWVNIVPLGSTIHYSIDVGGVDTEGLARITGAFDRIFTVTSIVASSITASPASDAKTAAMSIS
jgi:hypothetical protein